MRLIGHLFVWLMVGVLAVFLVSCGGGGGGDGDSSATYYEDTDGDGFGDVDSSQVLEAPQAGWVLDSTDCDDTSEAVSPVASETCDDWIDNDCDSLLDCYDAACAAQCSTCTDGDGDGFFAVSLDCPGGDDCDDGDETLAPGFDAGGCDCAKLDTTPNDTCAAPKNLGVLIEGQSSVASNNLPSVGDVDWYRFSANDNSNDPGGFDGFLVDFRFSSNPGSNFAMEVWQGGCPGIGTVVGDTDGGQVVGTAGVDDTNTYYVKVYFIGGSQTCEAYSLQLSNGVYQP